MAEKIEQIVNERKAFSTTLAGLSEDFENSSLGKLAGDDELYQNLNKTLEDMKETIAAVSEGKGTIGQLVNDDRLYQQLTAAMESIQQLLDEYREQSPILTFAGAIFGAF